MVIKLVIPQTNRQIKGGSITRWHKAEGDWVNFGDDLFDYSVDEINMLRNIKEDRVKKWALSMRVTSSDVGFLHKIHAEEGSYRDVGEVVAVLTIEDSQPVQADDRALAEAPLFRVVANVIDELS